MFYYVAVCERLNSFTVGKYTEYFTSEAGMQKYIEFFDEYLYNEGLMWIESTGTAHVNEKDMIVPDED